MSTETQFQPAATDVRIFPDGRLAVRDACRYLGLSYKTLATQRSKGIGPPYMKVGKAVFYKRNDLDDWLQSCRVQSTSEYRARNARQRLGGE
jgi:hypothetical protein